MRLGSHFPEARAFVRKPGMNGKRFFGNGAFLQVLRPVLMLHAAGRLLRCVLLEGRWGFCVVACPHAGVGPLKRFPRMPIYRQRTPFPVPKRKHHDHTGHRISSASGHLAVSVAVRDDSIRHGEMTEAQAHSVRGPMARKAICRFMMIPGNGFRYSPTGGLPTLSADPCMVQCTGRHFFSRCTIPDV